MITQYPYTLQRQTLGSGHYDENGDWVAGTKEWQTIAACRDEDGKGQKKRGADGSEFVATAVIQLPVGTEALKAGDQIQVLDTDGTTVRLTGSVLYSRKGQLHTQAWV